MRKKKPDDVLFEDRTWLLLKRLGFSEMNIDRNCNLVFKNGYTKQIDVLARDEENIFIIDCQTGTKNPLNARAKLMEYDGLYDNVKKAVESKWWRGVGRITILVAISSPDKRSEDKYFVESEKKHKNIMLWSLTDIEYLEGLLIHSGEVAKNQLYSVIFSNKKQKSLENDYLALKGKMAGYSFYSFLISAKELIKYAYVHHRELSEIKEVSAAYQRMIQPKKIKAIKEYVDSDGSFPNAIVVNFTKSVDWERQKRIKDVEVGLLTMPNRYGSAWIIDGQHRLFGAATSSNDILLPVLAFEHMDEVEQAELFVDINKKQTSVPGSLLWDLYTDIYKDSADAKQKRQYYISKIAKRLNKKGPLAGLIDIPSIPNYSTLKLSLNTVCATIEKFTPWELITHPTDESKLTEMAARIIDAYFSVLKSLWPEQWENGKKSVILSNNGFGVFIMVFKDIVGDIAYAEKKQLLVNSNSAELKAAFKTYLEWAIELLKEDKVLQRAIKSETGRGSQSNNAAEFDKKIKEEIKTFAPPRLKDLAHEKDVEKKASDDLINIREMLPRLKKKVEQSERVLREIILDRLVQHYGDDKWWKQGMPGELKAYLNSEWQKKVKRNPQLKREPYTNKKKFEHLTMGQVGDVIVYGANWENNFINDFEDKNYLLRRIPDILVLRNPVRHDRSLTDQDISDGMSGLFWLSNCLGRNDIKP